MTCILLKTSLEVILLLGKTVSYVLLGTSSKVTFFLGVIDSLVEIVCFARNTCVKCTSTEGANTESTDIKAAGTKSACIRDTSTYASGAYIEGACGMDTYIKNICIDSVSTIEYSEMHLQFIRNLKVGGAGLEIQVAIGWLILGLYWFEYMYWGPYVGWYC